MSAIDSDDCKRENKAKDAAGSIDISQEDGILLSEYGIIIAKRMQREYLQKIHNGTWVL